MRPPKKAREIALREHAPLDTHPHNRHLRSAMHHGDYQRSLAALPDGSIDAIITDPPYGVTDLAYDRARLDVAAMWKVIDRITKPTAVVVVFTCQPFTTQVINACPSAFRYELIWQKNTVTGFLNAKRRPLRNHENILVFCRDLRGASYNPQMEEGKPYKVTNRGSARLYAKHRRVPSVNHGTRYPRSVRFAQSVAKGRRHPSEKPLDLVRWLTLTYSEPGDVVCDPFMGSAPVAEAALSSGRRFIGAERDAKYFRAAVDRVAAWR